MIMAKHLCERCGEAITRKSRYSVTEFHVDEPERCWVVEVVIISAGWFCYDCREFILTKAFTQALSET